MKKRSFWMILAAVGVFALALLAGCPDGATGGNGTGGLKDLAGSVTISPSSGVTPGTELTANYSGNEAVTLIYQWKKDETNVGTNSNKYTPTTAGSYTVTVSAAGYNGKKSAAVEVTGEALKDLAGDVTISPSSGVTPGTELTASYSGDEEITYVWNKDGAVIPGAGGSVYTPEEAGAYTVTASAAGYRSKNSAAVTVTGDALPYLKGDVTLGQSGSVTAGTQLTASYSGEEAVTYQWNKDGAAVSGATGATYTPAEAGSYTVTVRAAGCRSKTSAAVMVTLPALDGTLAITGNAVVGQTLTADTTGLNGTGTYTFEWKRGETAVGTNAATYTLTAADTGTSITVTVTCEGYTGSKTSEAKGPVTAAPVVPYGISLSATGTHTFDAAPVGYATLTPLTVTVANIGTNATGSLTAALSGTNQESFTLSGESMSAGIAVGSTALFSVVPNTGLSGGTYTATVTVSGGNGITASFNVSFTSATYGISLDKTGTYTFPFAEPGYGAQTPLTVTVTNTGNQATGQLTAALSGTNAGSFTLTGASVNSIAVGSTALFSVVHKTGLSGGTYTATVTVSGANSITANFNVSFTANGPYIITGSGTSFTAAKNGTTVTANQTIADTLTAIRTDAAGNAAAIQFGNDDILDIGTASASFNNTGGAWGAVTLSGRITGSVSSTGSGTIAIADTVSVTSRADIANTSSGGNAVYNSNTGAVTISGGTVSATTGYAAYNASSGKITVSGTANVTSANVTATQGTIYLASGTSGTAVRLEITGGTVENTAGGGRAVYNASTGAVTISGGTVSATTGYAVYNTSTGAVTISGGTVSATTGYAVYNNSTGKITVSGTANVTSANVTATQGTIYLASGTSGTAVRLEITGGTVENENTADGGRAVYNASTGAVTISGGTVSSTTGYAVYNSSTAGAVTISGGTVSSTTGYAVYNSSTAGAVTISGGTVSSATNIAVYNYSAGTVTISGGTVSSTTDWAVYNYGTGTVTISGGTVSATTGYAVYNASTGKITVSGTAKVTSANTTATRGTIYLASSGTATAVRLEITGGTVENTASIGNAVYNNSTGAVSITGGTVVGGSTSFEVIETFESGQNNWVLVNGSQTNKWMIGTATRHSGSYSAYISNNNSANAYTPTVFSTVHLYKDITFPASSTDFNLGFLFKGMGDFDHDIMTVSYSATSSTPSAGSTFSAGTQLGSDYNNFYYNSKDWTRKNITLPAAVFGGKTMRLVFSWTNENPYGQQPPAAIDDIIISGLGYAVYNASTGVATIGAGATIVGKRYGVTP